jgi:hypothetical protein
MFEELSGAINDTIKNQKIIPAWLTPGIIFLLSKGKDINDSNNYRPVIVCPQYKRFLRLRWQIESITTYS